LKALLDTHVFLWWITDDPQLSVQIRRIISDIDNEFFFSAASCWEIAIKAQLGKIKLPAKPDNFISEQLAVNAIQSMPVQSSHALHVFNLPPLHRDPFDRIIVAQSSLENIPVITSDFLISQYDIAAIWR
jgi:PIN domain nuclease of toxin-antitoxin system